MATRWRNYKYSNLFKIVLFVLTISLFTLSILKYVDTVKEIDGNLGMLFEKDFMLDQQLRNRYVDLLNDISYLVVDLRSEDYIRDVASKDKDLNYNLVFRYNNLNSKYNEEYDDNITDQENFKKFEKKYIKEINQTKEKYIADKIKELNRVKSNLDNKPGLNYYIKYEGREYTNNPDFDYKKAYKFIGFDKDGVNTNLEINTYDFNDISNFLTDFYENVDNKLYLSLDKSIYMKTYNEWKTIREEGQDLFKEALFYTVLTIIFFLLLCTVIGRKAYDDDKVYYSYIGKIPNEILLLACLLIIIFWVMYMSNILDSKTNNIAIALVTSFLGSIGLIFVLGMIKDVKNKTLFTNTLIYKSFSGIGRFFRTLLIGSSLERKVFFTILKYPLMFFILSFITLILGEYFLFYVPTAYILFWQPVIVIYFIYRVLDKTKDFVRLKEGVQNIKNGNLEHKIYIEGEGELKELAENINTISEGLDKAIDNELKSERHRTELITNVSHDIRTPLTSIISYIDLLKHEEDEEKRQEYIEVLDVKSARLKNLIDDLFEASKVSSGNIPVELTKIDLLSLVTQALGELNDKIKEKNLDFIINSKLEKLPISADGKLLWRAIENLFSNIFKYALEGSRVYIDIYEDNNFGYFVMKNISKYELNITEEELMERFKRGDKSRTSDGSGLGLSIAESLIALQHGDFTIEIDGDLFKTKIKLPKYN